MRFSVVIGTCLLALCVIAGCGSASTSESTIESDELADFMAEHPELQREPLEYEYENE